MSARPRVTLKLATSLDGRIATASGESKWITGPEARACVHRLRAGHDAVLIGVETAIADDPDLRARLPGASPSRLTRVVLDSRQRIPSHLSLVRTARETMTMVITTMAPDARLTDAGVDVIRVVEKAGRPDLNAMLDVLTVRGIGAVLVEGGGRVAASFVEAGLVDAIEWFRAPIVLGGEGRAAVGAFGVSVLANAPRFRRTAVREVGADLWESYEVGPWRAD